MICCETQDNIYHAITVNAMLVLCHRAPHYWSKWGSGDIGCHIPAAFWSAPTCCFALLRPQAVTCNESLSYQRKIIVEQLLPHIQCPQDLHNSLSTAPRVGLQEACPPQGSYVATKKKQINKRGREEKPSFLRVQNNIKNVSRTTPPSAHKWKRKSRAISPLPLPVTVAHLLCSSWM